MAQQSWGADSGASGFRTTVEISKKVVQASQPEQIFRQFVSVEGAFGKGKGESVQIYRALNTDVESDSAAINELDRIPTTRVSVTPKLITVNEYGRAIPFTGKVEMLAEVDVESNVYMKALKNHMTKTIDRQVATAFKGSDVIYTPTGPAAGVFDVDGTASTTATSNITVFHLKEIVDGMKSGQLRSSDGTLVGTNRPIPFYSGNYYIALCSTRFLRGVKDDPEFQAAAHYANADGLYKGEIGRMPFYNLRFVEQNHLNALSNGTGTNSVLGEAVIFGEDPVREIVAMAEEVRVKIPEDYGRDQGIAWLALLGWGRVWDFSTDGEEHIVRITSA